MKRYEKESFFKSFLLFFLIQELFLFLVMWQQSRTLIDKYEDEIRHKMISCSYTLECSEYDVDFLVDTAQKQLSWFYKEQDIFMLFPIPTMEKQLMKISMTKENYKKETQLLEMKIVYETLFYSFILLIVSILFAQFSLKPLRQALLLNDEFVRDILHDLNTPLSALKINFKILEKKFGQNPAMQRSEQSIKTIGDFQTNLLYFLSHNPLNRESINLKMLLESRIKNYELLFPDITFKLDAEEDEIFINQEALIRIIDNLVSNASKYSRKEKGYVKLIYRDKILRIEDNGIGIKNVTKVFERFYRETQKGMGIGLHVVKKLCGDLNIDIYIESEEGKGTSIFLCFDK